MAVEESALTHIEYSKRVDAIINFEITLRECAEKHAKSGRLTT